ncbi:hypothetical protein T484DRAFT_1952593 [Baffinella frigidus]|nr:hypothetical protein T484DRAFT_1952593 [Cryptophyta sp. CCMP2293]|mmetsp:Transcript_42518/g.101195  ORF Transcript_42518/g.101195 Transcript_42518/m.101195 type:complete len:324 (+) Transcript_42518:93-1064(+)
MSPRATSDTMHFLLMLACVSCCSAFSVSRLALCGTVARSPLSACRMGPPKGWTPPPPPRDGDYVDIFCRRINAVMEQTVVGPIKAIAQVRDALPQSSSSGRADFFWRTVKSPPELPGLSRPVWLTIAASVPTALGWYGWYKFSVEEELFYDELQREGRATGAGGYGTLLLLTWCILFGGLGMVVGVPHADVLIDGGGAWILLSQVNLYRRVNELLVEQAGGDAPVYAWWALLPPPFDVVVGLRQVHFLAKYWCEVRGDEWPGDEVAEKYFPFISAPRFTLKTFARTPSLWFGFSKDWPELDVAFLKEASSVDVDRPAQKADLK